MAKSVQGQVQQPVGAASPPKVAGANAAGQPVEEKGSKMKMWIIIVVVLLVLGIGAWYFLGR